MRGDRLLDSAVCEAQVRFQPRYALKPCSFPRCAPDECGAVAGGGGGGENSYGERAGSRIGAGCIDRDRAKRGCDAGPVHRRVVLDTEQVGERLAGRGGPGSEGEVAGHDAAVMRDESVEKPGNQQRAFEPVSLLGRDVLGEVDQSPQWDSDLRVARRPPGRRCRRRRCLPRGVQVGGDPVTGFTHVGQGPCRGRHSPLQRRGPRAVVWTSARVEQWRRTGVRPPVAVWTATQTGRFLQAIAEQRLYALYHLIALRGLRRGEAAGLRWCDIDLDARVATINQQLQQYDGHLVIGPPKTTRSCRTIALDRTTVAALRRHRLSQLAERDAAGVDYHDSGYVFTGLRGDPMAPDRISRLFRALAAEAGLPPIRLHDLRHGAATLALAAGVDLRVVQDMLGHCSIVLTADTYTSVLPTVAHKAAEQVAALVLQAGRLVPGTDRTRRAAARHRRTVPPSSSRQIRPPRRPAQNATAA